jgi:pimeloyl-ACP methyl ester carboxylesterase
LARRWELASEPQPDDADKPRKSLLFNELTWVAEPVKRLLDPLDVAPAGHPRTVMLLPGFGAHPARMNTIAREIERAGHRAKRWGVGWNLGATAERFARIEQRLVELSEEAGEPIVLLGWSLGGVIAREIAKLHPEAACKVITMGSPFSGSPRANNGWRAYQAIVGHRVDEPEVKAETAVKPPVETIALWSPMDGVVHPRSACGKRGERDRAVSVRCTHMGFVESRDAIEMVLKELDF